MAGTSEQFKRRVLLAVSGMSPQVITETLYGLAVSGTPRWVPTEIHVITTRKGASKIEETLLDPETGAFHALCREYGLNGISFDARRVHIVRNVDNAELEDITTQAENEAMADQITEQVRELTSDAECALHVSLAGGRKTMSYFAGYALSLFGRAQDKLSHVLISPQAFESNPQFYYPSKESRRISNRDGNSIDCKDAVVSLADIPFVRLGDGLPKKLLSGAGSFSEVVRKAQQALNPVRADVHLSGGDTRLLLGGQEVRLERSFLQTYLALLLARQKGIEVEKGSKSGPFAKLFHDAAILLAKDAFELSELQLKGPDAEFDGTNFDAKVSGLKRRIVDVLGESAAKHYLVKSSGKRPFTRYGLRGLPANAIFMNPKAHDSKSPLTPVEP